MTGVALIIKAEKLYKTIGYNWRMFHLIIPFKPTHVQPRFRSNQIPT